MAIERFEIDTEQWTVVPRVPTDEMVAAGMAVPCQDAEHDDFFAVYSSMIAAAPQPEQAQQSDDVLAAALDNLMHDNYERSQCGSKNRQADADLIRAALARTQQPAPRPVPTSDWISLAEKAPDCLEVRIKLLDGSEINCWAQSDGDFYWKSGSGEIFIREHDVTHWLPTGLVRPAEVKP